MISHKVLGGLRRVAREDRRKGGGSSGEFPGLVVQEKNGERVRQSLHFSFDLSDLNLNFCFYYTGTN